MGTKIFYIGRVVTTLVLFMGLFPSIEPCKSVEQRYNFPNTNIFIRLKRDTSKLQYEILKGSEELQTITFENFVTNNNFEATKDGTFKLTEGSNSVEFELISATDEITHVRIIRDNIVGYNQPMDCISLNVGNTFWYGGPEDRHQYWPIERQVFSNYSYVTKEDHNAGLAERYWLNSQGKFFYVEDETPLFIEQNSVGYENKLCFSAIKSLPFDVRMGQMSFIYQIGIASNAKAAHMYAVQKILGHPNEYPDERMVQYPIWSTWALYKTEINDQIIREFADKIKSLGFENSQLEIDDDWEDCYGALTFRNSKFPEIRKLTDDLKTNGFRVTLWIHPFINIDCKQVYNEALSKGYLVLDHNNKPDTQWWNSKTGEAAYIDFTKSEAQEWFKERLRRLQTEDGIDSFKFDAGESSWVPNDPILNISTNFSPSQITRDYVRTVGSFGPMVEVRSGQGTQDLPIFVRMIDKDSEWKWENGLVTLITTLLQMNLNGYPFVLPDMIGGNGYNNKPPSKELFLRWLQANVFMPSLQFSYVPWNFDNETINISKKYTKLHADYTPKIIERFKLATTTGAPVNAPLWWSDPEDITAQGIFDQFMLGDDIMAAPVVEEFASKRDIYLTKGTWVDGNTNTTYKGPKWLMDYSAPLDILPYFIKIN